MLFKMWSTTDNWGWICFCWNLRAWRSWTCKVQSQLSEWTLTAMGFSLAGAPGGETEMLMLAGSSVDPGVEFQSSWGWFTLMVSFNSKTCAADMEKKRSWACEEVLIQTCSYWLCSKKPKLSPVSKAFAASVPLMSFRTKQNIQDCFLKLVWCLDSNTSSLEGKPKKSRL